MRGSQPEESNYILKIAYWYYKLNMTQAEIAQRLNLTRQRVNQIIGKLVEDGIVEIKINGLHEDNVRLESVFEQYFSLNRVFIFNVNESDDPLDLFGQEAAEALGYLIRDGQIIGVSWGVTLGAAVMKMQQKSLSRCTVVQMVGGLNSNSEMAKPDEIARTMAKKLSCDYHLLYAPAMVDNAQAREVILQDNAFEETFDLIHRCNIAVLGVGELSQSSTIYQQGFLTQERMERLVDGGYVGDLVMQPFKMDGTWEQENNVIGVSPETLAQIPCVAVMACGDNKTDAVLGAINTGCVDVLIIDQSIAASIAKKLSLDVGDMLEETT